MGSAVGGFFYGATKQVTATGIRRRHDCRELTANAKGFRGSGT